MNNRVYIQSKKLRQQEPVRQRDPVQFRTLMLILFTCSLIVLGILSYIWRGVEIISMGYKMRAIYYQQSRFEGTASEINSGKSGSPFIKKN